MAPWWPPSQYRGGSESYQVIRTAGSLASESFLTSSNSKNAQPEEKGGGWGRGYRVGVPRLSPGKQRTQSLSIWRRL